MKKKRNTEINLKRVIKYKDPDRAKEYNNQNKNTLEGINSSQMIQRNSSELDYRVLEITEAKQKKERNFFNQN